MPAMRTLIVVAVGLVTGLGIGYIDSRPTWDDTGITVAAVALVALALGAARPGAFWLAGLAVGVPVLAMDVLLHSNYGAALAVVIALVAAAAGAALGRLLGVGSGAGA